MRRLWNAIEHTAGSLKGFVLLSTVGIAALVFLGATLASTLLYEQLLADRSEASSREIARHNIGEIELMLRRGPNRAQIEERLEDLKALFPTTIESVQVYRSAAVVREYGGQTFEPAPGMESETFIAGEPGFAMSDLQIRYTHPLKASAECLRCHTNVTAGEVLGMIDIRHELQPVDTTVRVFYVAVFVLLGSVVLFAAAVLTTFITRRLDHSVDMFGKQVEAFDTIKDFDRLQIDKVDFGFVEYNRAFDHVAHLVDKIKQVAVDKGVLEFEIRLLEKFIITSNVVRDWREFVQNLLIEISSIVEVYALVTVFRVEEEAYECEVFWRSVPSEATAGLLEGMVRKKLQESGMVHGAHLLQLTHNIADKESQLPELGPVDIEVQTKTLFLDTPKIGGIVGIGVQSLLGTDNVRNMVIGSILTTLLNLVGSVKAIYKYTKDLEHYATRDPLTDLFNQRMFWELLGYEVGRARRHKQSFAVMVLDLDNFKTINDRFGHHFGDAFLQKFADVLHQAVRNGDIIARYGGDEFCFILPDASDTQAHLVAQRIFDLLEHFWMETPDGNRVRATTSIGIAVSPKHGDNPKDLFLVADNMMYKAKNSGKNAIAIPSEEEMAEVFRKQGEKALMIQNALDQQRIVPYFQPICHAATGEIVIHELLMRIQQDDGRMVVANEFIAEAEQMGIAHKMDYQLIEKAFAQVKRQNYEGMLFVNLSPKALIVGEFAAHVNRMAADYGIAPTRIVFEITERETVRNLTLLEKFVADAKLQGFSFAIDDFGSGYSSFQYIKCFPVDYIKIEGEFIRNMLRDEVYLAFVKSIVTLAKELKIKTIAEFVEDAETFAAVTALGIDYAQGYHIFRPHPEIQMAVAEKIV